MAGENPKVAAWLPRAALKYWECDPGGVKQILLIFNDGPEHNDKLDNPKSKSNIGESTKRGGKGEEECRKEDSGVDGDNAFEDVAKVEPKNEAQQSQDKSNGEERAGSKEEGDMEGSGAQERDSACNNDVGE
ncbi:predicted protein [Botrytis cinerea T4]|uniref:Uncharacterized protein n=1 Tax=Botryotinia fuckeliana (strain T4) TaxID=999810 RepID=G2YNV7_BOTF4|nr:predicted protein [Botrytis cinerea T4]